MLESPEQEKSRLTLEADWKKLNEVALLDTRWNRFKVFAANSFEMVLITLGLCLSVYQEDFFTIVFQLLLQWLLFHSMRDKGKNTEFQALICKVIIGLIGIHGLIKGYYILHLG